MGLYMKIYTQNCKLPKDFLNIKLDLGSQLKKVIGSLKW